MEWRTIWNIIRRTNGSKSCLIRSICIYNKSLNEAGDQRTYKRELFFKLIKKPRWWWSLHIQIIELKIEQPDSMLSQQINPCIICNNLVVIRLKSCTAIQQLQWSMLSGIYQGNCSKSCKFYNISSWWWLINLQTVVGLYVQYIICSRHEEMFAQTSRWGGYNCCKWVQCPVATK